MSGQANKTTDRIIRKSLLRFLHEKHEKESNLVICEEFGLIYHTCRIDVAVLNGSMNGYEIKSDADTLDRLEQQADLYSKIFDRMFLVCGARYVQQAQKCIPGWWGITEARFDKNGILKLGTIRRGRKNPSVCIETLLQMLWKVELISILREQIKMQGLHSKSIRQLRELASRELNSKTIHNSVRESIKIRKSVRVKQELTPSGGLSQFAATLMHSPVHHSGLLSPQSNDRHR